MNIIAGKRGCGRTAENPWNIPQGNVSETAEKRLFEKPMQSLREAYGYSMIPQPVRHLELSTDKGTKNVRETSDMVMGANGEHEGHEDKNAHEIG